MRKIKEQTLEQKLESIEIQEELIKSLALVKLEAVKDQNYDKAAALRDLETITLHEGTMNYWSLKAISSLIEHIGNH